MLEAWLKRTRDWMARTEKLLALPEQEFALWGLTRALSGMSPPVVCLCGDPGSGKSSLIRHALRHNAERCQKKIILAETNEWLSVRAAGGLTAMSANDASVVICESLQQLENPRKDGEQLSAWIDQARAAGIAVILTADRLPSQIDDLSPRLVNRLQGGLLATLRPLGESSQHRLLQHWSSQGAACGNPFPSTLRTVTTVGQLKEISVRRNSATAESGNSPTDFPLDLIADAVALDFQVSSDALRSEVRTRQLRIPREVAMSLARELTSCSLMTISRYFGCRSHTSVVRGCSRLQDHLSDAPSLRQQIQLLRGRLRRELSADCG